MVHLGGRPCLVSQYIEGWTFQQAARKGLSGRALLEAVGQAAEALADLHSQGTLHRDIKPSNLMLTPCGEVWLLDFGIALSDAFRESRTRTGLCIGSPEYLSPQRYTERGCDPASDVYALGVVSWRLFFRSKPFAEPCVHAKLHHDVLQRSLSRLSADCPQQLLRLLAQMLSFEEVDRPRAGEVAQLCEQIAPLLPGPDLHTWASEITWFPVEVHDSHGLVGRTLQEGSVDGPSTDLASGVSSSNPFRTPSSSFHAPVGLVQAEQVLSVPLWGVGVALFATMSGIAGASFVLAIAMVAVQAMEAEGPSVPSEVLVPSGVDPMADVQPPKLEEEVLVEGQRAPEEPRPIPEALRQPPVVPGLLHTPAPQTEPGTTRTQDPQLEILDAR